MAKDPRVTNHQETIQSARDEDPARESRASEDRAISENRGTTDELRLAERLAMLENVDTVLPNPPKIPGYHTIWLSTTNTQDSLERRFSLGYSLVHPDEMPGFSHSSQRSGHVTKDQIMINEMVLAKIPEELYLAYLKRSHHTRPLEQEEAISANNVISRMKDGRGKPIGYLEGEGHKELARPRRADFSGVMDKH